MSSSSPVDQPGVHTLFINKIPTDISSNLQETVLSWTWRASAEAAMRALHASKQGSSVLDVQWATTSVSRPAATTAPARKPADVAVSGGMATQAPPVATVGRSWPGDPSPATGPLPAGTRTALLAAPAALPSASPPTPAAIAPAAGPAAPPVQPAAAVSEARVYTLAPGGPVVQVVPVPASAVLCEAFVVVEERADAHALSVSLEQVLPGALDTESSEARATARHCLRITLPALSSMGASVQMALATLERSLQETIGYALGCADSVVARTVALPCILGTAFTPATYAQLVVRACQRFSSLISLVPGRVSGLQRILLAEPLAEHRAAIHAELQAACAAAPPPPTLTQPPGGWRPDDPAPGSAPTAPSLDPGPDEPDEARGSAPSSAVDARAVVAGPLAPAHQRQCRAAGLMPVRIGERGHVEVLLAIEQRFDARAGASCLNPLGGRMEAADHGDPAATAAREFQEEVGGDRTGISRRLAQQLVRAPTATPVWCVHGKYVLYLCRGDAPELQALPARFREMKRDRFGPPAGVEASELVWVPLHQLLVATASAGAGADAKDGAPALVPCAGREVPVSPFLLPLCRAAAFVAALSQFVLRTEAERAAAAVAQSKDDFVRELGQDWMLQVRAPPLPPPSPVMLLHSADRRYREVMNRLPSELQQRLVSVRMVRATRPAAKFSAAQRKHAGCPQVTVFHGTPERWRATAIALHGFDLKIQLHGRVLGDGVYSSTDPKVCLGYAGPNGSVVMMRGIVTPGTKVDGTVHVFPDGELLCPDYLLDFSPPDERDRQEADLRAAAEKAKREVEDMRREMAERERQFVDETYRRRQRTVRYYGRQLHALQDAVERGASGDDPHHVRATWTRLHREVAQYHSGLPLYGDKESVLTALRGNDVTVLMADTGSGKSTQVPQYLLDHVLDSDDRRRIAVLEPRRVNATSLCAHVSSERAALTQEVGYHLGRGDKRIDPEHTRIEFMTHGLFVQLAQDPAELLKRYAAVVLDEAHERSTEIELSLALLQRALVAARTRAGDAAAAAATFKVVVTSATIQEQADEFLRYLCVRGVRGGVVQVQGKRFPVHVLYRDDVQPDRRELGSGGAGQVMASYALQCALDLMQRTDRGNVLVFLPGEGHINDALALAQQTWLDVSNPTKEGFRVRIPVLDQTDRDAAQDESEEAESGRGWGRRRGLMGHLQGWFAGDDADRTRQRPKREQTVGVYPFHGKLSDAQRACVLHPKEQRVLVFTTNIAETGLTIPDVRYVIDTGLERSVRWRADSDVSEMVTEPTTLSSVRQRTGRAGRVASGICIRLFSREQEAQLKPHRSPQVESGELIKTAMHLESVRQRTQQDLTMLAGVPTPALRKARKVLQALGAFDEHNRLTKEGHTVLRLGIDLRLGRFLLACNQLGCLNDGALLAAVLSVPACERLLPDRATAGWYEAGELVHPSGDALTLLNIMAKYVSLKRSDKQLQWCQKRRLDAGILRESEETYRFLLEQLVLLQMPLDEQPDKLAEQGGRDRAILRGLCAAYYDHLAIERRPGDPTEGFAWLLDDPRSRAMHKAAVRFRSEQGPAGAEAPTASAPDVRGDADDTAEADEDPAGPADADADAGGGGGAAGGAEDGAPNADSEIRLRVSHQSTLWYLADMRGDARSKDPEPDAVSVEIRGRRPQPGASTHGRWPFSRPGRSTDRGWAPFDEMDEEADRATYRRPHSASRPLFDWAYDEHDSDTEPAPAARAGPGRDDQRRAARGSARSADDIEAAAAAAAAAAPGTTPSSKPTSLVVFCSVILTDTGSKGVPSINIVTRVTPDDVRAATPEWCRQVQFDRLLAQSERVRRTYPLSGAQLKRLKENRGQLLKKLRQRLPAVSMNIDQAESRLVVVAPHSILPLVEQRVKKLLDNYEAEVVLSAPAARMGAFIGPRGSNKERLLQDMRSLAQSSLGSEFRGSDIDLKVEPDRHEVILRVAGTTRSLLPLLLAQVQSALRDCSDHPEPPLVLGDAGARDYMSARLTALVAPPAKGTAAAPVRTVDEARLALARAAVWNAGCRVYGGFLRDWVVRGETATDASRTYDVDVMLPSGGYSAKTAAQAIADAVGPLGLRLVSGPTKRGTIAQTCRFQAGSVTVDMDLVDPDVHAAQCTAPGVEADVCNLEVDRNGLHLKVTSPKLLSLSKSIKHARKHTFVFYYDPGSKGTGHRLEKLLSRGWICLTPVPAGLQTKYASLCQPKSKYSRKWWA